MAAKLLLLVSALVALIALELQIGTLKALLVPWGAEWPYSSFLHLGVYFALSPHLYQTRLLEHVLQHATRGDALDVVAKVDEFCWAWPSMNVGDVKGKISDEALSALGASPRVVVELGSYMGYSTVRFASVLRETAPEAVLYSVDPNPLGYAVKTSLLDHAGLLGKGVRNELAYSGDILRRLAQEGKQIDYLFIDHMKWLYLEDVQLALSLGLLRKGSVIVADNVLAPGAPEYRAWMMANPRFETTVHETLLEYTRTARDDVLVSVFRG